MYHNDIETSFEREFLYFDNEIIKTWGQMF